MTDLSQVLAFADAAAIRGDREKRIRWQETAQALETLSERIDRLEARWLAGEPHATPRTACRERRFDA